jgi:hypothetical protein
MSRLDYYLYKFQKDFMAIDYDSINHFIRQTESALDEAYCASGVRMADSPIRRSSIIQNGPINHKRMTFYPCYDYLKADMLRELDAANIALPIDYVWFGRTFDGLDARFLRPLKENAPEDYQTVLDWFPLAGTVLTRENMRREHSGYYVGNKKKS